MEKTVKVESHRNHIFLENLKSSYNISLNQFFFDCYEIKIITKCP